MGNTDSTWSWSGELLPIQRVFLRHLRLVLSKSDTDIILTIVGFSEHDRLRLVGGWMEDEHVVAAPNDRDEVWSPPEWCVPNEARPLMVIDNNKIVTSGGNWWMIRSVRCVQVNDFLGERGALASEWVSERPIRNANDIQWAPWLWAYYHRLLLLTDSWLHYIIYGQCYPQLVHTVGMYLCMCDIYSRLIAT